MLAVLAPEAVGAKAPPTVQLCPAPSAWPLQLSADFVNWPASAPPIEVAIVPDGTPPVLVTVKAWAPEVVLFAWLPNAFGFGEMVRLAGVAPVPVRPAAAVPPGVAEAPRA